MTTPRPADGLGTVAAPPELITSVLQTLQRVGTRPQLPSPPRKAPASRCRKQRGRPKDLHLLHSALSRR